jgi:hypothetical protein
VGENRQSGQRVTVDEAARHLGLTVDAVRKRMQRDQLPHEKDAAGRVRIILDESETLQDESPDSTGQAAEESTALADELRNRIHYLERQVEEEREARRRADMLLAQLMQRIPELEAPASSSEARESPETVEAEQELGTERARHQMAESTMREGMDEERWRREEAERERDDLRRELLALRRQRESPETAEEASEGTEPRSYASGAKLGAHSEAEGVQRPWWRRVIGR